MNILLCQALASYISTMYIIDVPSGTGDKTMNRKQAIEIVMERYGQLPRRGGMAFVARIESTDYFIENFNGYCRLVTY